MPRASDANELEKNPSGLGQKTSNNGKNARSGCGVGRLGKKFIPDHSFIVQLLRWFISIEQSERHNLES